MKKSILSLAMLVPALSFADAYDSYVNTFNKKIIKDRAEMGIDHGGTVIYSYSDDECINVNTNSYKITRVYSYSNNTKCNTTGNIDIGRKSSVYEVKNYIDVDSSELEDGANIGNLTIKSRNNVHIKNVIDID